MTQRSTHGPVRKTLSVAVVAALAGLLFTASAQLAKDTTGARQPTGLADLVRVSQAHVNDLTARTDDLTRQVNALAADAAVTTDEDQAVVRREQVAAGTVAVKGAGLRVSLDDAPPSSRSIAGVTADDLVVHQQDVQQVINALWAGGAEAMTLQGERVTMTTAFRCSGNILLLGGKVFSPPYVVEAVGDPVKLRAAIDASKGVKVYRQWVAAVGLGWSVGTVDELTMPADTTSRLRYATLPDGTDPLRTTAVTS